MLKPVLIIAFQLLLLSPFYRATAQNNPSGTDTIFGFDPVLYNGRQYTYKSPRNSTGHPFLFDDFQKGWINVKDRTYNDLDLNYDILNHVLLLKYIDHAGARVVLEISDSWLRTFAIGNSVFELRQQGGLRPVIYQFIESGDVKVQYHWQKELNLENVTSTPVYAYSKPKRNSRVNINGNEFTYEKNREFARAFKDDIQIKVRNYLKINKIKVNKSSDSAIRSLVNYCNTLLNP